MTTVVCIVVACATSQTWEEEFKEFDSEDEAKDYVAEFNSVALAHCTPTSVVYALIDKRGRKKE